MAKRTYSVKKQTKKIQPVPLKLNYRIAPNDSVSFIDLAKDVSRVARKFIRQGKLFAIANVRVHMPPASTPATGNAVYISTIQQSWITSNAWHKSFAMWNKQQMEAIEDGGSESAVARFRDFKIYMDPQHEVEGNLEPVNLGPFDTVGPFPGPVVTVPGPLPNPDWDYSQIVIPNDGAPGVTNEYQLHMHGGDVAATVPRPVGSKSMVMGYVNSRSYPQSPDPVSPQVSLGWMSDMFDVGDDSGDVVNNAQFNNRFLPYDQIEYPGGDVNYQYPENKAWCFNRSTVGVNTFNLGGMVAPCGLIRIDQLFSEGGVADQPLIIEIELLPGEDRGYLLGNMQDM